MGRSQLFVRLRIPSRPLCASQLDVIRVADAGHLVRRQRGAPDINHPAGGESQAPQPALLMPNHLVGTAVIVEANAKKELLVARR